MVLKIQAISGDASKKGTEMAELRKKAAESVRIPERLVRDAAQQQHLIKRDFASERTKRAQIVVRHVVNIRKHTATMAKNSYFVAHYFEEERSEAEGNEETADTTEQRAQ